MKYIIKIHTYLKNLSTYKFIILMTLLSFLIPCLFSPIINYINQFSFTPNAGPSHCSFFKDIISACILAPLLETLIFQKLIITTLYNHKKNTNARAVTVAFISAILFGLSHWYSLPYIFWTFIVGLILAYSYTVYENNKKASPFWVVTAIHALRNFISALLIYFC